MLDPQDRAALTDLLHPPAGFLLANAVGTTYTLDLDSALTIPLSLAARRMSAEDDQLSILDAVRKAADRVDVFAQAGQLSIDPRPSDLVAFLEPMLHPVVPERGIFHPKVWFLEYQRGAERAYRFVCASRNLTDDRSWDVVISLDGRPAEHDARAAARETNAPLVALLRWLPRHTVTPVPLERRRRIDELATRWRDIEWTVPPTMKDLQFHVWGAGEDPAPEFWGVRGLIVSPFLTDAGLAEIRQGVYRDAYLVSRPESIDALPRRQLDRLRGTYVLDEAANPEDDEVEGDGRATLTGLHAKCYVFDRKDGAHVLLGSLNATAPALHSNVEVLVEVVGSATRFGVRRALDSLGGFLEEFRYTGDVEPDEEEGDRDLSSSLTRIAEVPWHARVVSDRPYALEFSSERELVLPDDVEVTWHPISRDGLVINGLPGTASEPTVVRDLSLTEITPFVILTVRDARGDRAAQRTVLLAQLHDDPDERRDAVIAGHLTDRDAFLRFLMLLLELGGALTGHDSTGVWSQVGSGGWGVGLFEALLRAVGSGRSGLAEVQRVVTYLSKQPGGDDVLPPGFEDLWSAVWEAQQVHHERH